MKDSTFKVCTVLPFKLKGDYSATTNSTSNL